MNEYARLSQYDFLCRPRAHSCLTRSAENAVGCRADMPLLPGRECSASLFRAVGHAQTHACRCRFSEQKKPCSVGRQGSTGWRLAQARGGSPTYSHHNNAAVTSPAPAFSTGSKRGPSLTACCKPRLLASNSEPTALLLLRLRLTADFTISSLDYTCLNCYQRYGSTRRGGDRFDGAMTCSMETSVGAATEIQLSESKHIRRPVWRIAA